MDVFQSRHSQLPGSSYDEVVAHARKEFNTIRRLTKRQPYVRSKFFRGDKVFVTIFWDHIMQKHRTDRMKRLKFYTAAIDLLRNSTLPPADPPIVDPTHKEIMLYRFYGKTRDGKEFCVQVKHDIRSGRKDFMSVFDRKAPRNS